MAGTDKLFALCEKGNHFYNLKELDRALYYYNTALAKGYDGIQILQRAQRLKDMGVTPRPPIDTGKARRVVRVRQEAWRQVVFVKANYPDRLLKSLETITSCTLEPSSFSIRDGADAVEFLEHKKPVMTFLKRGKNGNHVTMQYFTEMEKYQKVQVVDGKKIKLPAKRRKYHFFIVYDSFTDLLVQLRRILLLQETYYEEHRDELRAAIDAEFGSYKQPEIRALGIEFGHWLESYSVMHALFREHSDKLEYDYLKGTIADTLDGYLARVEKDPIFKIDYVFMIIVLLERLYKRFPLENRDKYAFVYARYIPCKKFADTFAPFLAQVEQETITEPVLHEFTRAIKPFRQALYK